MYRNQAGDSDVFTILAKRHGNTAQQPILKDLIGSDSPAVSCFQKHATQTVNHLIRQIRICCQWFIQSTQSVLEPGVDKDILRLFTMQYQIFTMDIFPTKERKDEGCSVKDESYGAVSSRTLFILPPSLLCLPQR